MAILYGIQKAVITELDPATGKPPVASGKVLHFDTAEEATLEPVVDEGSEDIKRNAKKILAVVREDDLIYGYDVKLTDNVFDSAMVGIVSGYKVTPATESASEIIETPMMKEGKLSKPFMLDLYIANYEGDSIVDYCKITFNKCEGSFPSMTLGKEFMAPEFNIKARENTKANKPIKSVTFVDTLPETPAKA